MAYRIDKSRDNTDIVIDGFELGIADSPHIGIANLRNVDISSVPGEAKVTFSPTETTPTPVVSELAFTVVTSTDIFTVADTTGWYNGMAITLDTVVTSTGIVTGRVYWIDDLSGSTFKLYKGPNRNSGQLVDVMGSDGSGTLTSYTLGKPIDQTQFHDVSTDNFTGDDDLLFILDENGRVWWVEIVNDALTNNVVYLGNDILTSTGGRAIQVWKNHIIVFRSGTIDALLLTNISPSSSDDFDAAYSAGWEYGFESVSSAGGLDIRPVLSGHDDILYYANSGRLGSLSENVGSSFDPTSGSTYTKNIDALDLPDDEEVISLAELGTDILIGGIQEFIYPWDRISSSFSLPIELPEQYIQKIVSSNYSAFVFAGFTGNIYVTNGSSSDLYKKFPDHLTGKHVPYFDIPAAIIDRNSIRFSVICTENSGTAIAGMGGVWEINMTSGALKLLQETSNGEDGNVTVIMSNTIFNNKPLGNGVITGWFNSTTFGIDTGSSNPFIAGETIIETDIIPIGTFNFSGSPKAIEFKLSRPLVAGESVELLQRSNLTEDYTTINTETGTVLSESFDPNFEELEWIQIKAVLTSTNTSPSFVPLTQIRIRM